MSNQGSGVHLTVPGRFRTDRDLKNVASFQGVSSATLEDLNRRCRWQDLEEGEALVAAGDLLDRVFLVLLGEFRFSLYTRLGKVVSLRGAVQGSFIGEAALAGDVSIPYSIEAVRRSTVASIGTQTFLDYMEHDRGLLRVVMRNVVDRQDLLAEQLVELTTLNIHDRVQSELVRLCRANLNADGSATIQPIPKNSDLARRIGTHREAVSRAMSHLQHAGVVVRATNGLFVPDVSRLADSQMRLRD